MRMTRRGLNGRPPALPAVFRWLSIITTIIITIGVRLLSAAITTTITTIGGTTITTIIITTATTTITANTWRFRVATLKNDATKRA